MASSFPNPCQGMVLWDSSPSFFQFTPTGPSPSLASLFRLLRLSWLEERLDPQLHIPLKFPWEVRFGLFPFRSPLLRESRYWFLFLPLLRCFSSGGSRSLVGAPQTALAVCNKKSHSGIHGSTPACGYPWLIAACHALLQHSSLVIHQTASHVGLNRLTLLYLCGVQVGLCMVSS